MRLTIAKKLAGGFGISLLALVIIGVVVYRGTTTLSQATYQTEHTYQVLEGIQHVVSVLKDGEIGQRGYILTGEERYLEPYNDALAHHETELGHVEELTKDNPNQQRRLEAVHALIDIKFDELKETIDLRRTKGFEAAVAVVVTNKGKKAMDGMRKIFDDMEKEEVELLAKRVREEQQAVIVVRSTIIFGTIIAFVLVSFAGFFISRSIVKPINTVAGRVAELAGAAGDLTVTIPVLADDEVGQLAAAFNKLLKSLSGIIKQIRDASVAITSASSEILSSSQEQASGAREQSSAVAETSSAAKELSSTSEQVGGSIRRVAEAASHALAGMGKIKESISKTGGMITSLGEKSQKIGKITELIDDVADQTNLLAVNASIEAARAGEQGKGFTVVADEIRKLSDSTAKSTKDITSLIELIQHEMTNSIMSMESSVKSVDEEARLAHDTTERSKEIAMSANQQISGSKQIAEAMTNIDEAMKQISAGAQQSQAAVKQLTGLAKELKEMVDKFKV